MEETKLEYIHNLGMEMELFCESFEKAHEELRKKINRSLKRVSHCNASCARSVQGNLALIECNSLQIVAKTRQLLETMEETKENVILWEMPQRGDIVFIEIVMMNKSVQIKTGLRPRVELSESVCQEDLGQQDILKIS